MNDPLRIEILGTSDNERARTVEELYDSDIRFTSFESKFLEYILFKTNLTPRQRLVIDAMKLRYKDLL